MSLKSRIKQLLYSQKTDEDSNRRELILNILLLLSIFCFVVINLLRIIDVLSNPQDRGLPLIYTLIILALFSFLFWLSKKGLSRLAASLLIITYSLPMFYSFIFWGADLPAALLLAVLIIILSGILLGERLVLISAILINLFLLILTQLQIQGTILVKTYWRVEKHELSDAITYFVLFMVIAAVAWLFAYEIKKALNRARQSELELRLERDSLEVKVIEKTAALRQVEAEKINQLYRLAEFGRLSSGIFHDLINPLTAISLNLEQIKNESEIEDKNEILSAKSYLNQALIATRKMESLIASIKKQIGRENNLSSFSANEEITQILQILNFKARQAKVIIVPRLAEGLNISGDAVKFGQIVTNLLCNAIEACEDDLNKEDKKIIIDLAVAEQQIILSISDNGPGIAPENITQIFTPFFSTKKENNRGLGLGLSSTKNLIEKDFKGSIEVTSQLGQGTKFLIKLPGNHEK